jgi:hypothetical protein
VLKGIATSGLAGGDWDVDLGGVIPTQGALLVTIFLRRLRVGVADAVRGLSRLTAFSCGYREYS